jgi:hypothetical protein
MLSSASQEQSTADEVFYTWVARSRSGSSSFTALAPESTFLHLLPLDACAERAGSR